MIKEEFEDYSLVLMHKGEKIFSSKDSRLKPLAECIEKFSKKYKDCTLYDKVVGLAAARLIIYSKMIKEVNTPTASELAKEMLEKNKVKLKARTIVPNICLDSGETCPMELKAIMAKNNEEFYDEMKKLMQA